MTATNVFNYPSGKIPKGRWMGINKVKRENTNVASGCV